MNTTIKKSSKTPFLLLFSAFFFLHLLMPHIRDDLVIEQGMDFSSITPGYVWYLITSKYEEWSSRIFINVMTLVMGKLPHIIWIFLDSVMVVFAAWSVSCLTREKNREDERVNFFLIAMFALYPFSHMATAGWKATTITYLWALACGLYAMIPIRRWLGEEQIRRWEYPLFLLAILYGANQEQMSAVLTGMYGCTLLYALCMAAKKQERKKTTYLWFLCLLFLIALAGFFSALLCPGNGVRVDTETASWFADYGRLTWISKLEIGFSSAGYELFYKGNLCFLVLSGLLLLLVFAKYQDKEYRMIAAVPFFTSVITGPLYPIIVAVLPGVERWKTALTIYGTITVENYTERFRYLPLIGIFLMIGCVLLSFYLIYENSWKTCAMCVIFLIGYASRVVLGFSPTVWASNLRTYLFLYMAVIVLAVFSYQEILQTAKKCKEEYDWLRKVEKILYIVAILSFISHIFAV